MGEVKDLTLRDWFAGMALQGMLADGHAGTDGPASWAELSYMASDAMLAERGKGLIVQTPPPAKDPKPALDPLLGMPYTLDYLQFVRAYPVERGKKPGQAAWSVLNPDAALRAAILAGLEQHKRLESWQDPQFVPNIDKWLSERRWEEDLRGQKFIVPSTSTALPKCGRRNCSIRKQTLHASPKDGVKVCDACLTDDELEMDETGR